ncbi:MAG: FAD-binding oxidoreductase [Spirochaetales bacterium]|nr:FAD-binding oxidoreductase [Spirochaetales bacterium]
MSNTYDVAVIGAGSVGVPTALALKRKGFSTLVIDKFSSPGQGSNKAAIGGVRATHSDPAKIRLGLRSLEIFSTWKETYGHDIEWTTGGYAFPAYEEKDKDVFQKLLEIQRPYNLNIDWLSKRELLDVVPDLNRRDLLGGTFSPEDGHCSTLLASRAFYDQAKQEGVQFRFSERVEEIKKENGRVSAVKTDKGTYRCSTVINAGGAWADSFSLPSEYRLPLLPESHEAGITEPVGHFLGPMVVDMRRNSRSSNIYFFQIEAGQIVFCLTPDPPVSGLDRRETSDFLPLVAGRMIALIPSLASIRVRRTWRGIYPMTPDGSPVIGWIEDFPGYFLAGGMCGQGFMLGPGIGELITRMAAEEELSREDREILKILSPYRDFKKPEVLE